jgi:outer membrane protein assembly factor BamA
MATQIQPAALTQTRDAAGARLAIAMAMTLALPAMAGAQTRAEEIEASREKKAATLHPETVSRFENVMLQIKQQKVMERLSAGFNGLRGRFGTMATGSGFALGPEFFREDLAKGNLRVNASAVLSTRLWQKYEAGIEAPKLAGGRIALRAEGVRRDYRSLEFYGVGPDSEKGTRTDYRLKDTSVQGLGTVMPTRRLRFGGTLGGLWAYAAAGKRDELANTESLFDEASAPGLTGRGAWIRSSVFGQFDYRDDPAGPKSGGNYVSEYTWHNDQSLGAFSFRRWDIDVQQYIPFFNKTRRLALRGRMTMTESDAGQRTPFYLQPYIGGSDDLRGFRPYRFTDRNAVVYNAEYRWEIFSGLDGAVFFDAGKVMPHRGWLKMNDLETSAGFGMRFNARNRTFLRLDVGFSHEGAAIWLKFNDPFLPRLYGAGATQPLY